jgi:acyl-CoA dehydrogenase
MSSPLEELPSSVKELKRRLERFVKEQCQPAEEEYEQHMSSRHGKDRWTMDAVPPCMARLKNQAQELGLWNIFLPHALPQALLQQLPQNVQRQIVPSQHLSVRQYGILCEVMGQSFLAPEACNCSAPDTGNMEVLLQHGTLEQQLEYLVPLLQGKTRSAFLMTEPQVASSDATNIQSTLTKRPSPTAHSISGSKSLSSYILNGRKWWSTGAMDPRCQFILVLSKMEYSQAPKTHSSSSATPNKSGTNRHGAHTVVLVPMPHPGVKLVRPLTVFGYDDAPHGHAEVLLENVELDSSALVLGEGRGFEIAQSRLGPGRVHHCMRAVGQAQRCLDLMVDRSMKRRTFGKALHEHGMCQDALAQSAIDVQTARLLTLQCAATMDAVGPKHARDQIAMIKVAVPRLALAVVDRAMQVHGGAGVCQDFILAKTLAGLRTLRIADGPDEVHIRTVSKLLIANAKKQKKTQRSRL